MKRWIRRVIFVGAGVFLIATFIYISTSRDQGVADYELVLEQEPKHATHRIPVGDGGTVIFRGRCYEVVRLHRMLPAGGTNFVADHRLVLGGKQLRWSFPSSLFFHDREHFFYLAYPTEATKPVEPTGHSSLP